MAGRDTDDLARALEKFDEQSVVALIKKRYESNSIYTNINAMMLAVNPYKDLGLYALPLMRLYGGYGGVQPPPHIFAIAANAFKGLLGGSSQSIIVTGESGAGKTETCRRVLQYLAHASHSVGEADDGDEDKPSLHKELTRSNVVLEAFGNARTVMNDNSSRFGKFLKMSYDGSARLIGGTVVTYLLEKTRVVGLNIGERNYHVFYALLQGVDAAQSKELVLSNVPDKYHYTTPVELGRPPTESELALYREEAKNDRVAMAEVTEALQHVGMAKYDQWQSWRTLAALLHFGNIDFAGEDEADIKAGCEEALAAASMLLGLDIAAVRHVLVTRCIKAGGEFITKPNTSSEACILRDSITKAIYARLFDRLIEVINDALSQFNAADDDVDIANCNFIGILDIFGFEIFEVNSLEQMLINYANERLQGMFNELVFNSAQNENEAEGLARDAFDAEAISNQLVLSLFISPKKGLFSLLNEECIFPKGTDATFLDKLFGLQKDNPRLLKPPPSRNRGQELAFAIQHYAGVVPYSADRFLLKNKDPLSEDLMIVMQQSSETLVAELFPPKKEEGNKGGGAKNRFKGVVVQFAASMNDLSTMMLSSHTHFVRCVKPNLEKKAHLFEEDVVTRQMKCSGVFEAVRVYSSGFPDRITLKDFIPKYSSVAGAANPGKHPPLTAEDKEMRASGKATKWEREAAAELLAHFGVESSKWALGHSKLFLRSGVMALLNQAREIEMMKQVVTIQAAMRGRIARKGAAGALEEKRLERLAAQREEERQAELARLKEQQGKELEQARNAAEERRRHLVEAAANAKAAEEKEVVLAEERAQVAAAAVQEREADLANLRGLLDSEVYRREDLQASVEKLATLLQESQDRVHQLEQELAKLRAAAEVQASELQAEVARWREEAGLMEQQARNVQELADAQQAQSKGQLSELREEVQFFRSRFVELAAQRKAQGGEWADDGGDLMRTNTLLGGGAAPRKKRVEDLPGFDPEGAGDDDEEAPKIANASDMAAAFLGDTHQLNKRVLDYARYLGLQEERDEDFMWIAEEAAAATAEVPAGWVLSRDPKGKLYYLQESTGANTRRHPRDEEFRHLVCIAKIEMMHAAASGDLSYLMYDTSLIRAMEESLCCGAKEPVSASLQRLQSGHGTGATVRYAFDIRLEDGRWFKCCSLHPFKDRNESGFRVLIEAEESREYRVRCVSKGKYLLSRDVEIGEEGGFGSAEQEELACCVFSSDKASPLVHRLEVLASPLDEDDVIEPFEKANATDGLLSRANAEKHDGLGHFSGFVSLPCKAHGGRVELCDPETPDEKAMVLELAHGVAEMRVDYGPPVAPMQSLLSAMAFMHWLDTLKVSKDDVPSAGLQQRPRAILEEDE